MATQIELTKLIASASLYFSNFTLKDGLIEAYQTILYDIPFDALAAGLKVYLSENQAFFPSAGQWRERSMAIVVGQSAAPSEYEAWENVRAEMRKCGRYFDPVYRTFQDGQFIEPEGPKYSHPLVKKAVDCMGGYRTLYESENPDGVDRAHFYRVYQSLVSRELNEIKMLPDVRQVSEHYQQLNAAPMMKQLAEKMGAR